MSSDASNPAPVPEAGRPQVGAHGLLTVWKRVRGPVALAILLILVTYWWVTMVAFGELDDWAFDFRQFWQGALDVTNGDSPYPSAALLATAGDHLDPEGIREVFRFPYPAGAAVLLAPLGMLGFHTAAAVWSALLIASLLAALWILGVRDWRVLAIVVSSAPVISSVRLGTFTPVLVLLLAAAWRWRDRRWAAGAALALAISLKLFVWPVVLWLVATRRYGAAIVSGGLAAVLTLAAWAAIGFDGLREYPELLRRLSDIVADRGFSLVALGTELGLPHGMASALPWIVGLALTAGVVLAARDADRDGTAFSLAVVASIAFTPIVWLHYFALLVVPLAVSRPRFAWPWLLLWVFWLLPEQESQGDLWRIALAALLVGAVLAATAAPVRRQAT